MRAKSGQSALEAPEIRKEKTTQGISNPTGPRLLSVKQACAYSGLTPWCIRQLVWTGKLPFLRVGEKKIYVERHDLDSWIDRNKETFGA